MTCPRSITASASMGPLMRAKAVNPSWKVCSRQPSRSSPRTPSFLGGVEGSGFRCMERMNESQTSLVEGGTDAKITGRECSMMNEKRIWVSLTLCWPGWSCPVRWNLRTFWMVSLIAPSPAMSPSSASCRSRRKRSHTVLISSSCFAIPECGIVTLWISVMWGGRMRPISMFGPAVAETCVPRAVTEPLRNVRGVLLISLITSPTLTRFVLSATPPGSRAVIRKPSEQNSRCIPRTTRPTTEGPSSALPVGAAVAGLATAVAWGAA
mmetsp:Transcript_34660/g.79042  ORF Transcript_34660/g.79042 Transcript_34660/m.79042 type:complete len:266 (-) Transcript_34660:410-1207(-)